MSSSFKEPIVELNDVGVTYSTDIQALEHITLKIYRGDFAGLIGPNGAGKSTLLNVVLGIVKPTTGYVRLFGQPITAKNLRKVGYVPQIPYSKDANFPSTVYETVMMGRIPYSLRWPWFTKEDHRKVEQALQRLEIQNLKNRKIGELSGGQTQRVFTAKALTGDPEMLIFDEPTSGVDTEAKREFYSILEQLNRELGITTILSIHDLGVVTRLARTIICINRTLYFDDLTTRFDASTILPKAYNYAIEVVKHGDHP
ncbi:MAG TPA: ABC transporter ATP-binding protein [Methylomirabilota bacterium]|nr:ABC transporter ATP-binding protein [Methylomirabilota bacterium]